MLFRTVLLDPPWLERGAGKVKRGADRHYPLLPTVDIPRVIQSAPVWHRIADDAHMYLWATNNFLQDGLWVMSMLGFRYVTKLEWVKDRVGLGQYWRGRTEPLLFGVRGEGYAVRTERRDLDNVIDDPDCYGAPRGEHSAKPELFRDLIEQRSHGPYLEMFARTPREGWTLWGNEAPAG